MRTSNRKSSKLAGCSSKMNDLHSVVQYGGSNAFIIDFFFLIIFFLSVIIMLKNKSILLYNH